MENTRRLRIYGLHPKELIRIFNVVANVMKGDRAVITLPRISGIPDDARVVHVGFASERMAVEFVVEHRSFEEIADHCEIPRFPGKLCLYDAIDITGLMTPEAIAARNLAPAPTPAAEKKAWEFLGPPPK
jgi:hypothetical protein